MCFESACWTSGVTVLNTFHQSILFPLGEMSHMILSCVSQKIFWRYFSLSYQRKAWIIKAWKGHYRDDFGDTFECFRTYLWKYLWSTFLERGCSNIGTLSVPGLIMTTPLRLKWHFQVLGGYGHQPLHVTH